MASEPTYSLPKVRDTLREMALMNLRQLIASTPTFSAPDMINPDMIKLYKSTEEKWGLSDADAFKEILEIVRGQLGYCTADLSYALDLKTRRRVTTGKSIALFVTACFKEPPEGTILVPLRIPYGAAHKWVERQLRKQQAATEPAPEGTTEPAAEAAPDHEGHYLLIRSVLFDFRRETYNRTISTGRDIADFTTVNKRIDLALDSLDAICPRP